MDTKKYLKKKIIVFVFSLVFIIVMVGIINNSINNGNIVNSEYTTNVNNLQVVYKNNTKSVNICLKPVSFQQWNEVEETNIVEILNKSMFSTEFSIRIVPEMVSIDSISLDKVYYSINNSEPKLVGSNVDNVIYTNKLGFRKKDKLDIKVWVSRELMNDDDIGKSISYKFEINEK